MVDIEALRAYAREIYPEGKFQTVRVHYVDYNGAQSADMIEFKSLESKLNSKGLKKYRYLGVIAYDFVQDGSINLEGNIAVNGHSASFDLLCIREFDEVASTKARFQFFGLRIEDWA